MGVDNADVNLPTMTADGSATCSAPSFVPDIEALPPLGELANHPRYRVLELIGKGGMGSVYKAEHLFMRRTVALKLISRRLVGSTGHVQRFHREVTAAARLVHPNIVHAYDAEQAGENHFLVMEYVEGASLADVLRKEGRLGVPTACEYVRQAALGLQYAFEQGMVHRDIKPHNLMLTTDGVVKILDFGLARFAQETQPVEEQPGSTLEPAQDTSVDSLTKTGSIMGTPDYMAPEQVRDAHGADIRADIYSLGCTLYHLLAGGPPFKKDSAFEKIKAHSEETARPLSGIRPDVPANLVGIVSRMMEKNPTKRFQTPAEVATALLRFTPAGIAHRRKIRRRLIGVLLAVVAVPIVIVMMGRRTPDWTVQLSQEKQQLADEAEAKRRAAELFNQGDTHRLRKDYDQAITAYTETIKLDPQHGAAYDYRGDCYNYKQLYDRAVADYTAAINLGRKPPSMYLTRAQCYSQLGRHDEAVADFSEALRLDPNSPTARETALSRMASLILLDRFDAAAMDLALVEKVSPNNAFVWAGAGGGGALTTLNYEFIRAGLALGRGDREKYRQIRDDLSTKSKQEVSWHNYDTLCRVYVLGEDSSFNSGPVVWMAEQSAKAWPDPMHERKLTLTYFRAGRLGEVISRLGDSKVDYGLIKPVILSLTHHRLGHADEARQWFDKVVATPVPTMFLEDAIEYRLLRREAEGVFPKK